MQEPNGDVSGDTGKHFEGFNSLLNMTSSECALKAGVTFDIALVVMLFQEAAVVSQFLVFMWLSHRIGPGRRTAAVLRK